MGCCGRAGRGACCGAVPTVERCPAVERCLWWSGAHGGAVPTVERRYELAQAKYEGTLARLEGLRGLEPEEEQRAQGAKLQVRCAPFLSPFFTAFLSLLLSFFSARLFLFFPF